jgi:hypothetical protein
VEPEAARRYVRRVRRIIRRLRAELKREVVRAHQLLERGHGLGTIVQGRHSRFSPLGLYITAHHVGQAELAGRLRERVVEQHHACPLYRMACRSLLPPSDYPVAAGLERFESSTAKATPASLVPLN